MKNSLIFMLGLVIFVAATVLHSHSEEVPKFPEIGSKAPLLVANTIAGEGLMNNQFDGKLRLVVFWSIESEKTAAHIPLLKVIRKKHQDRDDFMMLSVSTGDEWEDWRLFQEKQGVVGYGEERSRFPFYSDHRWYQLHELDFGDIPSSSELYGAGSLPSAYLIDRDGKLVAVLDSLKDLEARVAAFLKERP